MTEIQTAAAPMTESPATPAPGIKTFWLIRQDRCPKLGAFSAGVITYQVLTNETRDELFVRIAGNEGGGYVSDEAVPFTSIVRCVNEHEEDKPMRSGDFRPAFVGRSNNNSGFLAAVLLHEQLLNRHPALPHLLIDAGGWGAWGSTQLEQTLDRELTPVAVGRPPRTIPPRQSPETAPDGAESVPLAASPAIDPPAAPEPASEAKPGRSRRR